MLLMLLYRHDTGIPRWPYYRYRILAKLPQLVLISTMFTSCLATYRDTIDITGITAITAAIVKHADRYTLLPYIVGYQH
jgi:hypothetical protein